MSPDRFLHALLGCRRLQLGVFSHQHMSFGVITFVDREWRVPNPVMLSTELCRYRAWGFSAFWISMAKSDCTVIFGHMP